VERQRPRRDAVLSGCQVIDQVIDQ